MRLIELYESFVKLISPKIINKKVGHIINVFSLMMCPIFFIIDAFSLDFSIDEIAADKIATAIAEAMGK